MPDIENPANAGQDQPASVNDGASGVDNPGGTDDHSKNPDKGKEEVKTSAEEEPTVRKRMSPKDFIIQRQQRKIEKLKSKTETSDEEDSETGDSEIAPEDEELISKVVAKRFAPILSKTMADEDNAEIAGFIAENPDFKPYEAKIRKFMSHDSRRHLPVSTIAYEVAGKDLMKLGAERSRKADEEASHTQTGGGAARGGTGEKKVWDMSKEEFAEYKEKVRRTI